MQEEPDMEKLCGIQEVTGRAGCPWQEHGNSELVNHDGTRLCRDEIARPRWQATSGLDDALLFHRPRPNVFGWTAAGKSGRNANWSGSKAGKRGQSRKEDRSEKPTKVQED